VLPALIALSCSRSQGGFRGRRAPLPVVLSHDGRQQR
jgi:hypothetical protein